MIFKGELLHIHTCASGGEPMRSHHAISCNAGSGLEGDRYALGTGFYSQKPDIREVTLIEQETLIALQRDHDIELLPNEHRRNLTVQGVPLNHLVGQQFVVGDVVLEGGRLNTPCKYLDKLLGKSVCDRLRHRSGLNCRIITGGRIEFGSVVGPR
ncbi:MAG: MOSC domain-containing protein [Pseudomonadota bacterium]